MVYCGKPSKSCQQCRKRDIKCDKGKDSCGQCIRANLLCPGYHDQSSLVFRDQTKAVICKARMNSQHQNPIAPGRPLLPSLEDRAKALFASRYALGTSPIFPYMESFWLARPPCKPLAVGVRAVSLAYLSVELRSDEILQKARQRYGSTLLLVNEALQSSQTAKENGTLLTVLLLDLFETLVQRPRIERSAISKHTDGALTLIKIAGKSQFQDPVRVHMFHRLSINILLGCLESEVEVPTDLIFLRQFVDVRSPEYHIEDAVIRFITLRENKKKGESPDVNLIVEKKTLDEALLARPDVYY